MDQANTIIDYGPSKDLYGYFPPSKQNVHHHDHQMFVAWIWKI